MAGEPKGGMRGIQVKRQSVCVRDRLVFAGSANPPKCETDLEGAEP